MSALGNIIWLVFGGLIMGAAYIVAGVLLCITIIGIPFGLQAIQLGFATLLPFGKTVTQKSTGDGALAMIFNVLWLVLFGWEIAVGHMFFGLLLCLTIIGIPLGKQHFKLVQVALLPFSYRLE